MKKITTRLLTVLAGILFLINCDDFGDTDVDRGTVAEATTGQLMTNSFRELMYNTRDEWASARMALPWIQYWSQTAYSDESRYQFRESVNTSLWREIYLEAQVMKHVIDLNSDPAFAANVDATGSSKNHIAVARIMLAYIFDQLVTTYGDIPYYSYGNPDPDFQGLQAEVYLTPVFASQQKIHDDMLKDLKEASDMLELDKPAILEADIVYNKDASLWKKFANSLRLRIAVRIGNTTEAQAAIAAGVFDSNADNTKVTFESNDRFGAPMYRAFFVGNRYEFGPSTTFVDLLKGEKTVFSSLVDPRLYVYAAPNAASPNEIKSGSYTIVKDPTLYTGPPMGYTLTNKIDEDLYTYPGKEVLMSNYAEVLMEYSEVAFLKAEVNGWNQSDYEAGIRASMEKWGVEEADITTYLTSVPAASEENVLTQKYIALYMQPYAAWSEYRRTGYPKNVFIINGQQGDLPGGGTYTFEALQPYQNITDIPSRLPYPVILQTLNGANRKAAVDNSLGGIDLMTSKLIFDRNHP